MLSQLAHAWEARCIGGSGFTLEFDPTWLDAARELRHAVAVLVLLDWVGRQSSTTRARL